jgi:hypothetical protein
MLEERVAAAQHLCEAVANRLRSSRRFATLSRCTFYSARQCRQVRMVKYLSGTQGGSRQKRSPSLESTALPNSHAVFASLWTMKPL